MELYGGKKVEWGIGALISNTLQHSPLEFEFQLPLCRRASILGEPADIALEDLK